MNIGTKIGGIAYYLPDNVFTNEDIENLYENMSSDKIFNKTGISSRHVASEQECVSDLAVEAAKKLFIEHPINKEDIDFIIMSTHTPDYIMPSTACIVQDRLGIPKSVGAFDINLGCTGFIYGLALSKGLIHAKIAKHVLLITAETLTKYTHPYDKSFRTIIGDAAAATWISTCDEDKIHSFSLGTDGGGLNKLIIPAGGCRLPISAETKQEIIDDNGSKRTKENIYMDGPAIFSFAIDVVPKAVEDVLKQNNMTDSDISMYIFHQANKYMLDFLKKHMRIPDEKFYVNMRNIGNTSSSTIPIAISMAEAEGKVQRGDKLLLAGFGSGLSWGSVIIDY